MSAIETMFLSAAENGDAARMLSPGIAGLSVLLASQDVTIPAEKLEGFYEKMGWSHDHSLSKGEFLNLVHELTVDTDCTIEKEQGIVDAQDSTLGSATMAGPYIFENQEHDSPRTGVTHLLEFQSSLPAVKVLLTLPRDTRVLVSGFAKHVHDLRAYLVNGPRGNGEYRHVCRLCGFEV